MITPPARDYLRFQQAGWVTRRPVMVTEIIIDVPGTNSGHFIQFLDSGPPPTSHNVRIQVRGNERRRIPVGKVSFENGIYIRNPSGGGAKAHVLVGYI